MKKHLMKLLQKQKRNGNVRKKANIDFFMTSRVSIQGGWVFLYLRLYKLLLCTKYLILNSSIVFQGLFFNILFTCGGYNDFIQETS